MNLSTKQKQAHRHRKQTGKGWESGKLEIWDQQTDPTTYKKDNQQGPTVQNRKLYSIFSNNSYGKRI